MPISNPAAALFDTLVDIELSLQTLYTRLATRFPAHEDVWRKLAADERRHATWLRELQLEIQEGEIAFDPTRIPQEVAQATLALVQGSIARVDTLTLADALDLALANEDSLIERAFYEVATSTKPIIAKVYAVLGDETSSHRTLLQELRDAIQA
jgi:hypothetical protein